MCELIAYIKIMQRYLQFSTIKFTSVFQAIVFWHGHTVPISSLLPYNWPMGVHVKKLAPRINGAHMKAATIKTLLDTEFNGT